MYSEHMYMYIGMVVVCPWSSVKGGHPRRTLLLTQATATAVHRTRYPSWDDILDTAPGTYHYYCTVCL